MPSFYGRVQGDGVINPLLIPILGFYGPSNPTKFCMLALRKTGSNLSTVFQYSLDGSIWTPVVNMNNGTNISVGNANTSVPFNQKAPHFRISVTGPVGTDYIMHWVIR